MEHKAKLLSRKKKKKDNIWFIGSLGREKATKTSLRKLLTPGILQI